SPRKAGLACGLVGLSRGGVCQFQLPALRRVQQTGAVSRMLVAPSAAVRPGMFPVAEAAGGALFDCASSGLIWFSVFDRASRPPGGEKVIPGGDLLANRPCRSKHPGMAEGDSSDAALVLVGHGSTLNADSAAPTYQHADELRRRKLFAQVLECFWKLEPPICGVLRGVFASRVFVVPLFISEGYFTEEIIPRELGLCANDRTDFPRVQQRGSQMIYYCGPIGTHDSMTQVLLARAAEIVQKHPFPIAPKPTE